MNDKVKKVTEMLQSGVTDLFESEKYKEYLTFMGSFYNYSANNCLLIMMQKPDASLVAGFRAWGKKNRHVKKGEKAITIIAPCPHKKKVEQDGEEKEVQFVTYKATSVFDISQTEGADVPEICTKLDGDIDDYEAVIEKFQKASEVSVRFEPINSGAYGYYSPSSNEIVVKEGLSQLQTIKTLTHEIAHSMLHCKDGEQSDADRKTKEVQAESIAFTVLNCLGFDTSEYSFGYIAGWSSSKDAKELLKSLEVIRSTSKKILDLVA